MVEELSTINLEGANKFIFFLFINLNKVREKIMNGTSDIGAIMIL